MREAGMMQAHEEQIAELRRRLEALERAADPRLPALLAQAAAMKAQGAALKAEVRAVLAAHEGPRRLKAYAVRSYLRRDQLPSLRRMQEIIQEIRSEEATLRGAAAPSF